jgi:hypothetical protein
MLAERHGDAKRQKIPENSTFVPAEIPLSKDIGGVFPV